MPFDLTSIWIPVGIIGLLGLYMVAQFIQERRESRELLAAEAAAAATAAAAPPPAEKPAPAPAAAPAPSAPAEKKKAKLRWRTAWIWLPFLAGFFGQAYLSIIKPMMDAAGQ
ncbi:MAG: hypothetical protein LPK86_09745 [Alphaproteobacteria bacterium]|nr:hypothetical protein [Alphaproteobacteria bacterium]